jgi:hypothetical protein
MTRQSTFRPSSPTARSVSSISSVAKSIGSAVKKGVAAVSRPLKKVKRALTNRSKSSATLDDDQASSAQASSPSVPQDASSEIEIVEPDPEKELSK